MAEGRLLRRLKCFIGNMRRQIFGRLHKRWRDQFTPLFGAVCFGASTCVHVRLHVEPRLLGHQPLTHDCCSSTVSMSWNQCPYAFSWPDRSYWCQLKAHKCHNGSSLPGMAAAVMARVYGITKNTTWRTVTAKAVEQYTRVIRHRRKAIREENSSTAECHLLEASLWMMILIRKFNNVHNNYLKRGTAKKVWSSSTNKKQVPKPIKTCHVKFYMRYVMAKKK